MQLDDETTATQLRRLLEQQGVLFNQSFIVRSQKGNKLSLRTILRAWANLGWVFQGSAYCQTIRYGFLALVMSYC